MGTNPPPASSPAASPRKSFALTGRSRPLDPRTNAVRADIADVRLAEYVFAPHYAAPSPRRLVTEAVLRTERADDSDPITPLAQGELFELLDETGGVGWGVAVAHGLVGYVNCDVLGPAD